MTLTPGTRLGVFEIVSTLGIGGMGEVYLATDSRLKRQVAIKILPQSLAADTQRLARFQREAEMLASLNHPNIAAVFGVEDTSAGKALVMELVEGSDLRVELARRTPTVAEALAIARQLARAIGAAHQRGIVHRDLKPGNIRLRPDGTLKVLDFGLAKAAPDTVPDGLDTVTATQAGTIMGTPRYMSPEQARGEAAGTQSDIWSFGVILYELLAGRPAFEGGSSTQVLSQVLTSEPDYQRLPPDLPARIRLLVRRCLRKDPQQRLHHIADAAIEIDDAMSPTDEIEPAPASNRTAIVSLVAVSIVAGAAAGWWATRWPAEDESPILRTEISFPERAAAQPWGMRHLAFSPDGSRIAFASRTALQIRRLDASDVISIKTTASSPFWSPDGRWVGYLDGGAGLKKVPAAGGAPTVIVASTDRPAGADWRADGTIVFATSSGLFLVHEDGTGLRSLLALDTASGQRSLVFPQFLPETNAVLFTIVAADSIDRSQIALVDLDTLKVEVVVQGGGGARYAGTGHLLYASGQTFMAIRFDPRRRRTSGDAAHLPDVSVAVAADNGVVDFSLSEAGDLAFLSPAGPPPGVRLSWVDRRGREEPLDLPPGRYAYPRVSPDGTRVVMDIGGANRDVWIYDVPRRNLGQLASGPTEDLMPVWSPDGRRVFFASDRSGNFEIYSRASDGATPERMEFARDGLQFPQAFTPDGTRLTLTENYNDVVLLHLSQPPKVDALLNTPLSERLGEVSPDGKWIAYESNEAGQRTEVFVRSFPDVQTRREKVSIAGGRFPRWNPSSSRELFYVTPDGGMMAAAMSFSPSLSVGTVTKLFEVARPPASVSGRPYDVSALDGRFLVSRATGDAPPTETRASLVLNWAQRLRDVR